MSLSLEKNYKTVILEVRPRLQSVNAFVSLLNCNTTVKIILDEEQIKIIDDDRVSTILCKGINAVPNSLSSFKQTDNYIVFRFVTNNSLENLGSFKTELLQNTVASIESLSNKPVLTKGVNYTVQCINCSKALNVPIKFQRILPLPSDSSDPNEWFCHAQSSKDNVSLDPKETDIFYTHCYLHINKSNLLNIKGNDKVIVCKFCLNWLGIIYNQNTLRIWLNTVKFLDNNSAISTDSLSDIFHSFKDIFRHSLYNSLKLMIVCQTSSSQSDSVLIWVLEKKLQIFIETSGGLKKFDVAKVLFKYAKSEDEAFKQWQSDSMINLLNISKPMMLNTIKHLHKFNKMLPPLYSKSNDLSVSYIFMYEPFIE
ncbi:uncharacterized protein LOC108906050 [Anoplophora glabripennis]|uniref:uncharacterized protein LOC108906050 n=1 Tax=Anoplophora glabripennis TaxID=217634 RepID=UPI0008738824|nr:uncharacterized protein LOC108906050 [Anoplophora glabripennis]